MKNYFLGILIGITGFLVIVSCKKETDLIGGKNIKVDVLTDVLPQVKVHDIVVLDSAEAAIFGGATRISHILDNILIFDARFRNSLLLFDKNGKYITTVPQGKGPYEVVRPVDFSIWNNEIYILDIGQRKILVTDADLNPLKEFKADVFGRNFEILDEDNWLFYSQSPGFSGTVAYSYFLYPKSLDEAKESLFKIDNEQLQRVRLSNTISREATPKVFCRPFDHNIYSYDDQSGINIKYNLDFGSLSVTQEDIESGLPNVYEKMRNGSKVSIDGGLIETEEYLACSFAFKRKVEYLIFSKAEDRSYCSFNSETLPKGNLIGSHDGRLILLVQPDEYRKFTSKAGIDPVFHEVDQNALHNFILVYFKLT